MWGLKVFSFLCYKNLYTTRDDLSRFSTFDQNFYRHQWSNLTQKHQPKLGQRRSRKRWRSRKQWQQPRRKRKLFWTRNQSQRARKKKVKSYTNKTYYFNTKGLLLKSIIIFIDFFPLLNVPVYCISIKLSSTSVDLFW